MRNESKNNEFVSNFFFSSRRKRKHMRVRNDYNIRVRNYYNLWRTKKIIRKKIKIILKKYLV